MRSDMLSHMSTMIISLPDDLRTFVEGEVAQDVPATRIECVRELIGKDPQRTWLRDRLIAGVRFLILLISESPQS